MRLSLWPGVSQPWPDVLRAARFADAGGWHCLYVEDHFFDPDAIEDPLHEVTASVAALAAATERVRLATLVLSVTHRHPAVIANWAATVDHISDGRFTLGIGAGWAEDEHTAYGLALGTPAERVHRFAEAIEIATGMLAGDAVTLDGSYYQVTDAVTRPRPVQARLPILVGAKGGRMLGLTARHADEWNAWCTPEQLTERNAALDAACARAGRDPRAIARSTQALVKVTDSPEVAAAVIAEHAPRPVLAGTPAQIATQLEAYREAGADEFIIPTYLMGTGTELEDALSDLWDAASTAGILED